MKKTVLALAVLGAFSGAAFAQSNVTIYGRVDTGLDYVSKVATGTGTATGSQFGVDSGLRSASRIGFKGTEDLGGGLAAQFTLENGYSTDSGASSSTTATAFSRTSTVGLVGNSFGDLQLGRRKDFTAEVYEAYGSVVPFGTFNSRIHGVDRSGGQRANNIVYYSTPNFGGFRANVSYGAGETVGSSSTGQSYGIGGIYDKGPFGIGLAYWQSRRPTATGGSSDNSVGAGCAATLGSAGDTCNKVWVLGSHYTFSGLTLRGTYSEQRQPLIVTAGAAAPNFATFTATAGTAAFTAGGSNNTKQKSIDLGADYELGSFTLRANYIQSRFDFIGATSNGKLQEYMLGGEYNFSKRTKLYLTVANQRASNMYNPGIIGGAPGRDNSVTATGLGILHYF